jgi:hypothetical protein
MFPRAVAELEVLAETKPATPVEVSWRLVFDREEEPPDRDREAEECQCWLRWVGGGRWRTS